MLTNEDFRRLCDEIGVWLRDFAPKDTGNLAYNAIRVEYPSPDVCEIYVDESIAPYMPYTEFPWISPKWNGKQNPNEGWFEQAAKSIYVMLTTELKVLKAQDIDALNKEWEEFAPRYFKWQATKTR